MSAPSAQEQLAALTSSREQALHRIAPSWKQAVGLSVAVNTCLLSVVLPIVLSDGWSLLVQGTFLAALIVLVVKQRSSERVKRPLLRVPGMRMVSVLASIGVVAAFSLGIYARLHDNAWLGATALVVNVAAYLLAYGGLGFLLRRQDARLT